jgi:hypothetical protein
MKRTLTFLSALMLICLLSFNAQAQYAKGDITASAGISLGLIGYGGYGFAGTASGFLPVTANVEYSITDAFAIGAYAGYYGRTYKYSSYKNRWAITSFGARGTYHATPLINDLLDANVPAEKWDLYGTVLLGYEVYSYTWGDRTVNIDGYNSGRFILGPVIGARYFFSPKFGAFLELGRGAYGAASIGISGKF